MGDSRLNNVLVLAIAGMSHRSKQEGVRISRNPGDSCLNPLQVKAREDD